MWLPDYQRVVVSTSRTGDTPRQPGLPPRIVLHTTEGLRLFDYPYPPHFTLGIADDPHSLPAKQYWTPAGTMILTPGEQVKHQHCDLSLTSYALLHRDADPETNHAGSHCVQVEIISQASTPPSWSDQMYGLVAGWLADVVTALPVLRPALDNYPAQWSARGSWGFTTPYRVSWPTWQGGLGGLPTLWGHQHVPGNDHWDPGALDVVKLTRMAKAILGTPPVSVPQPTIPAWRLLQRLTRTEQILRAHDEAITVLRQRLARMGAD